MKKIRIALIIVGSLLIVTITAYSYATGTILQQPGNAIDDAGSSTLLASEPWSGNPDDVYGFTGDMTDEDVMKWRKLFKENKPLSIVEIDRNHYEVAGEQDVITSDVEQWKELVAENKDFKMRKDAGGKFRLAKDD